MGITTLPTFKGQQGPGCSATGGWNLYVNPHSKNLAATSAFVKWTAGTEAQTILATKGGVIPTVSSVLDDPAVQERVRLPLLRSTLAVTVMFRILQAFGMFDLTFVLTQWRTGHLHRNPGRARLAGDVLEPRLRPGSGRSHHDRRHRPARLPVLPRGIPHSGRPGGELVSTTTAPPHHSPAPTGARRRKRSWNRPVTWAALLVAAFVAAPLCWLIATSFKPVRDVADPSPSPLPANATLNNYEQAFGTYDFGTYLADSAIVTVTATLLVLGLGTSAGYALARLPVRDKSLS